MSLHSTLEFAEVDCSANFTGTQYAIFKILFCIRNCGVQGSCIHFIMMGHQCPDSMLLFGQKVRYILREALEFYSCKVVLQLSGYVTTVAQSAASFRENVFFCNKLLYLDLPLWLMLHVHAKSKHVCCSLIASALYHAAVEFCHQEQEGMVAQIVDNFNDSHI